MPDIAPALKVGQPFSEEHGLVGGELEACASHDYAQFKEDNASLSFLLEEATCGTSNVVYIKLFSQTQNGRCAWEALVSQCAGEDNWRLE